MNLEAIQVALISAFKQWGLPKQIRLDNGTPFRTGYKDVPSPLVLWLTGLGITIIFNKKHTPQQNGIVENHNGLTARWAEAHTKSSVHQLQQAIDWVKYHQLHEFPVAKLKGQTRIVAFPELAQNQTKYQSTTFDFTRVLNFLNLFHWIRIVDKTGCFLLFHQKISLGRNWARKAIAISFNPTTNLFTAYDENQSFIKTFVLTSFTANHVQKLTVFQRTNSNKRHNPDSP